MLWLVRAGRHGEREAFALDNNVAVIGWGELPDLSKIKDRDEMEDLLKITYPDKMHRTVNSWESQVWPFVNEIVEGDLIALPLKRRAVIAIGEVVGEYRFEKDNPHDARHTLPVKWRNEFPRNQFGQDLLYSLGAGRTVCRIQRNNAEERVRGMLDGKKDIYATTPPPTGEDGDDGATLDLEQFARDQISNFITQKFKGHGLTRLVGAILQAQGYQVQVSPEGPDGGVDIIAGYGAIGFDQPRIAVQVKSSDAPIDVSVVRELQGVMSSFGADMGLIVSWGGYKGTVEKEAARQFFKIRLWDADNLVRMLEENYDKLPEEIQAELPLKRIWTLVQEEE